MTEQDPFSVRKDNIELRLEVVLPAKALNPNVSRDSLKLGIKHLEYVPDYLNDGEVSDMVTLVLKHVERQLIDKVKEVERGSER